MTYPCYPPRYRWVSVGPAGLTGPARTVPISHRRLVQTGCDNLNNCLSVGDRLAHDFSNISGMKPLNLQEAAQFLRMSKSSLYQRKDIPRYRRPGSRALLFDQDELEIWIKTGRIEPSYSASPLVDLRLNTPSSNEAPIGICAASSMNALDIQDTGVYHRNPRYR